RRKIDDRASGVPFIAKVRQRPLDAVDALLDGDFRHADENRLRQTRRRIDLDLDRQPVDPDQSKRIQLGKHGAASLVTRNLPDDNRRSEPSQDSVPIVAWLWTRYNFGL